MILVMMIVAIVLAIAIPRFQLVLDRITVHAAASDVTTLLSTARTLAIAGRSPVAVDVDSGSGTLRVRRGAEVVLSRSVGRIHGVKVGRTRDSLTYDPRGLGRGAANLSIVLRLRAASETVFVSRFGRVR
jgi:Tfp pilus assembly protein FimT